MPEIIRKVSREKLITAAPPSSPRNVIVGRNYVTVKYRFLGKDKTIKLSNESIIESGRKALAKVPVSFD